MSRRASPAVDLERLRQLEREHALRLTPDDVARELDALCTTSAPKGSTRKAADELFALFDRVPESALRRLPQSADD